jgi:TPR repeat protein
MVLIRPSAAADNLCRLSPAGTTREDSPTDKEHDMPKSGRLILIFFGAVLALSFAASSVVAAMDESLLKKAESGDPGAQFNVALNYDGGTNGAELDHAKAAEWYKKAAEQGHVSAMFNLAVSL